MDLLEVGVLGASEGRGVEAPARGGEGVRAAQAAVLFLVAHPPPIWKDHPDVASHAAEFASVSEP